MRHVTGDIGIIGGNRPRTDEKKVVSEPQNGDHRHDDGNDQEQTIAAAIADDGLGFGSIGLLRFIAHGQLTPSLEFSA
ncbi:hypothetical protein ACFSTD_14735 [Novosphingobium colocasiae]